MKSVRQTETASSQLIWCRFVSVKLHLRRTDERTDAANMIRGVCPSVRLSHDGGDRWTLLPCVFVGPSVRFKVHLRDGRTDDSMSVRPSVS